MPYYVEKDTNLKRVVAEGKDAAGYDFRETESVVYPAGSVVYERDIAPEQLEKLEAGDNDHLNSLVTQISEDKAAEILAERGQTPPVAPEHEAEAEVLYQDGQDVLTRDEVVDSNPNGDPEPVEEEVEDDSEGRKSADPDSLRIKEVDERRRKDGDAPSSGGASERKSVKDLKKEAADLGVEGRSNMNQEELEAAIAQKREEQSQSSQG